MLHTRLAPLARRFSLFAALALLLGLATPALAMTVYIFTTLKELAPEQKVKVADPRPVQLVTEFQTNGATNPKATAYAKPLVLGEVKASGVVGTITDTPAEGSARLGIVLNNIPDKDAAKKGFGAGLTLGLAGTITGDSYEVTLSYTRPGGGAPIVRVLDFRILYMIGKKKIPDGAVRVQGMDAAVEQMLHLTISNGLNQIAADPAFGAVPAAAPAPVQ